MSKCQLSAKYIATKKYSKIFTIANINKKNKLACYQLFHISTYIRYLKYQHISSEYRKYITYYKIICNIKNKHKHILINNIVIYISYYHGHNINIIQKNSYFSYY